MLFKFTSFEKFRHYDSYENLQAVDILQGEVHNARRLTCNNCSKLEIFFGSGCKKFGWDF